MARLVLHIGSHKTGTTSIQRALVQGRRALARAGLTYLHAPGGTQASAIVSCRKAGPNFHAVIDTAALGRLLGDARGDAILSTELLFFLHDPAEIARLRDALARFDEIRVIAYLRRQDRLLISHKKQIAVPRARPAARMYGTSLRTFPRFARPRPQIDRYFDYAAKIGHWRDVFGAGAVTVRLFEPGRLKDGDAVADFMATAGLDLAAPPAEAKQNTAFTRRQILVGLRMKKLGVPREDALRILRELGRDADEPLAPSRADAGAFLDRYRASNRALAATLAADTPPDLFSDDMSMYPETGNDRWDLVDPDGRIEARLAALVPAG